MQNTAPSSVRSRHRNLQRRSSKDVLEKKKSGETRRPKSANRLRNSVKSLFTKSEEREEICVFVTMGFSHDVKSQLYPSMWNLYKSGLLPNRLKIFTFARSTMVKNDVREKCRSHMTVTESEVDKFEEFWKLHNNHVGSYLSRIDYDDLNKEYLSSDQNHMLTNRLYYLAMPIQNLDTVAQNIRTLSQSKGGWTKVMVEKPFGKDLSVAMKMTQTLLTLCKEDDLYRLEPCLCKDIVQNIIALRFSNSLFNTSWNRNSIESVEITLKDSDNTLGRGKYFDSYGIICDVMQLQGLHIMALIAMEKPLSTKANDIRDEKVKLMKSIKPLGVDNVVLGQYTGNPNTSEDDETKSGYYDDPEVARDSLTPTFCAAILHISNERWDGVPFVMRCGKALDEQKSEIRIRYRKVPADMVDFGNKHNEMIIQIEPKEDVTIKAMTKTDWPSISMKQMRDSETPVNLTFLDQDPAVPFDNLLLNVLSSLQTNFIRTDELSQAWRIFGPLLQKMEVEPITPVRYTAGSAGPAEADKLVGQFIESEDKRMNEI